MLNTVLAASSHLNVPVYSVLAQAAFSHLNVPVYSMLAQASFSHLNIPVYSVLAQAAFSHLNVPVYSVLAQAAFSTSMFQSILCQCKLPSPPPCSTQSIACVRSSCLLHLHAPRSISSVFVPAAFTSMLHAVYHLCSSELPSHTHAPHYNGCVSPSS